MIVRYIHVWQGPVAWQWTRLVEVHVLWALAQWLSWKGISVVGGSTEGDGDGGMTTGAGCHVGGGIMMRDGGGGGMTAGTSWASGRAIVATGTYKCMG